jgi:hypothetical protein
VAAIDIGLGAWGTFGAAAAYVTTALAGEQPLLQPTPSACSAGSQSLRVCNNDFQSCSSVCTATALDPNADVAGCSTRCCSQFKACLNIRGCTSSNVNCF